MSAAELDATIARNPRAKLLLAGAPLAGAPLVGSASSAAAAAALPRKALEKLEKERAKKYSELEQREERHKKMGQALQRIGIQKALQGKGPVMKMKGKGDNGGKVFKWKQRRKK